MLLRQRSTQAESIDQPDCSAQEIAANCRNLDRANRLFFLSHPFVASLPRLAGISRCHKLSILDVGAGDGWLGCRLRDWAALRGWHWDVTGLDSNHAALQLHPERPSRYGSALQLPFADASFDWVIAAQMSHHLPDAAVVRHFREAWRVARQGLLLCDLHRNLGLYSLVWLTIFPPFFPTVFRQDALISVRKGFRLPEWRALAAQADINNARVWLYAGTRIMLEACKPGPAVLEPAPPPTWTAT